MKFAGVLVIKNFWWLKKSCLLNLLTLRGSTSWHVIIVNWANRLLISDQWFFFFLYHYLITYIYSIFIAYARNLPKKFSDPTSFVHVSLSALIYDPSQISSYLILKFPLNWMILNIWTNVTYVGFLILQEKRFFLKPHWLRIRVLQGGLQKRMLMNSYI